MPMTRAPITVPRSSTCASVLCSAASISCRSRAAALFPGGTWESSQAQSGNPLYPFAIIGPGTGISLVVRPDINGTLQTTGNPNQWFANPSVLSKPCIGSVCHPGDMSRDSVIGPNFLNTDFSVTKDTKVTERLNLQFRAEMFDVFNHPNFGNPQLNAFSGFGLIQSTRFPTGDFGSARQIQFTMKVQF